MKTRMKHLLVSASGAIVVALLAFSLTLGSSRSVRAEDGEALATARPDMVLVAAKDLEGLEQRVSHLEEMIASLAEAPRHIHQLCVYDDSGAETCVTKAQLDALLTSQAHTAAAVQPAPVAGADGTPPVEGTPSVKEQTAAVPPSEPLAAAVSKTPAPVVPTSNPEPPAAAGSNGISPTELELTESILTPTAPPAAAAAQPSASPDSEAAKNDDVQGSILTPTDPPMALAVQPSAPPDSDTDDLD